MPAFRGNDSCGIRHLESFNVGPEGAYYDTLMLMRDSKVGMKKVGRMQLVQRFFVDARLVHTRSTANAGAALFAKCQDRIYRHHRSEPSMEHDPNQRQHQLAGGIASARFWAFSTNDDLNSDHLSRGGFGESKLP